MMDGVQDMQTQLSNVGGELHPIGGALHDQHAHSLIQPPSASSSRVDDTL